MKHACKFFAVLHTLNYSCVYIFRQFDDFIRVCVCKRGEREYYTSQMCFSTFALVLCLFVFWIFLLTRTHSPHNNNGFITFNAFISVPFAHTMRTVFYLNLLFTYTKHSVRHKLYFFLFLINKFVKIGKAWEKNWFGKKIFFYQFVEGFDAVCILARFVCSLNRNAPKNE